MSLFSSPDIKYDPSFFDSSIKRKGSEKMTWWWETYCQFFPRAKWIFVLCFHKMLFDLHKSTFFLCSWLKGVKDWRTAEVPSNAPFPSLSLPRGISHHGSAFPLPTHSMGMCVLCVLGDTFNLSNVAEFLRLLVCSKQNHIWCFF